MLSDVENYLTTPTDQLVSNWDGTHLYKKTSWLGRFWQLYHWVVGDVSSSLQSAIKKIFAEARELDKFISEMQSPQPLESCWKDREVSEVVPPKMVKLQALVEEFKGIPLELVYRELSSSYPSTDNELREVRTKLQNKTLGHNPWNDIGQRTLAPKHLIFAPLIAIAHNLAGRRKHSIKDYQRLFRHLLIQRSKPNSAPLLLGLIKYFRTLEMGPIKGLPPYIREKIRNPTWVRQCNSFFTIDKTKVVHDIAPHTNAHYFFEKRRNGSRRIGITAQSVIKSAHAHFRN